MKEDKLSEKGSRKLYSWHSDTPVPDAHILLADHNTCRA